MKLCGLDFETANNCNGSIYYVGVAIVPEANSHGVNCMADMFGITFQHHDALEDAESCAKKSLLNWKFRKISFADLNIPAMRDKFYFEQC